MDEIRLEHRSVPDRLRYLAGKLDEDEKSRGAVALALGVLADEIGQPPADDLPAWLRKQIASDGAWTRPDRERLMRTLVQGDITINDGRWVEHAAAQLAADREMKLAILDEHAPTTVAVLDDPGTVHQACAICWPDVEWYPCRTVRLLGAGYEGCAGYRQEWKP